MVINMSNVEIDNLPKGHYKIEDLSVIYNFIMEEAEMKYDLLEVGSYLGRSTSSLVRATYDKFKKQGRDLDFKLHCVDPFYGGEEPPAREVVAYQFLRNMLDFNILDFIRVYPITSLSFIEAQLHLRHVKNISILHLDGSHLTDIIKQEIRWFGTITEEAIIMHDTDRDEVRSCFENVYTIGFESYIETEMMTIFKRNRPRKAAHQHQNR